MNALLLTFSNGYGRGLQITNVPTIKSVNQYYALKGYIALFEF